MIVEGAGNEIEAVDDTVMFGDDHRELTGLPDDGAALVDRALAGDLPMLAINPLKTPSEKSEQSGFANLVRGAFGMFRNTSVHAARINWPMTKEDAAAFGLPNTSGAVISAVTPDQPAAKAGLRRGDVITEFNGRPVPDSDALVTMVVGTGLAASAGATRGACASAAVHDTAHVKVSATMETRRMVRIANTPLFWA